MGVPLFTSVPPRILRHDAAGNEIGADYFASCVASWRAAGCTPVSINAAVEPAHPALSALNLPVLSVDRHFGDRFGKPLLSIGDFVQAARAAAGGGPLVLVNADIRLNLTQADRTVLSTLAPGQCVFGKRRDIPAPDLTTGPVFDLGYDFFAMHSDDLADFTCDSLFLGLPWWDHFLPLWLILRGVQPRVLSPDAVLHLDHLDRWDLTLWRSLGPVMASEIAQAKGFDGSVYARKLQAAQSALGLALHGGVRSKFRLLSRNGRASARLYRQARVNIATIDGAETI